MDSAWGKNPCSQKLLLIQRVFLLSPCLTLLAILFSIDNKIQLFVVFVVHTKQNQQFCNHGKKLESTGKTYFGDVGLRNYISGGERQQDIEKVIENVVYHHLVHLGYSVSVGQLRAGEIDFVCTRPNQRVYVQVAWMIDSEATFKREFGALQSIKDDHPKFVISATPLLRAANHEGIIHLHLRKFLTDGFAL